MKITNKHGLPEAIVQAVRNDPYSKGGAKITASSISNPPRLMELLRRHGDNLSEDASDRVWALFGQALHTVLERSDPDALTEQRLFSTFLDWRVSGAFDRLDRAGALRDYKVTSAWTLVYGDRLVEWEQQLNTLAELAVRNGLSVASIGVVAFLRDWSERDAGRVKNYPAGNVVEVPLRLWTTEERVTWIEERVRLHQAAGDLSDEDLPECSPEERWWNEKKGNIRCERYCAAAPVCSQALSLGVKKAKKTEAA